MQTIQYHFNNIFSSLTNKAFPIIDFFIKYQKPLSYTIFLTSLHPMYIQFNQNKKEQENKIKNFSTKNDSKIIKESLSNVSYEILFDFQDVHQLKKSPFEINGFIRIKFDFDEKNFPDSESYLKIDFQGQTSDIYLNKMLLRQDFHFFIDHKEKNEIFEQQTKDCIFIDKNLLTSRNNEIYLKFSKNFLQENFNSINNPFFKLEDIHEYENRSIHVK